MVLLVMICELLKDIWFIVQSSFLNLLSTKVLFKTTKINCLNNNPAWMLLWSALSQRYRRCLWFEQTDANKEQIIILKLNRWAFIHLLTTDLKQGKKGLFKVLKMKCKTNKETSCLTTCLFVCGVYSLWGSVLPPLNNTHWYKADLYSFKEHYKHLTEENTVSHI